MMINVREIQLTYVVSIKIRDANAIHVNAIHVDAANNY
jgi:hypothetical protein